MIWREYASMKKKSTYEIDGNLYEFNNYKLKEIIKAQNPIRGAYEQFYRKMVSLNLGISYDTVKGWVKNDTNPALDDVKKIAEVLDIPFTQLLECTHYGAETVKTRIQKITFRGVMDPFQLRYDGFSNVFDMIIGMGYNTKTKEYKDSDFAERIIKIIGSDEMDQLGLPELLGYHFVYTDDVLRKMSEEEFEKAWNNGFVDDEGNSFFGEDGRIAIDRLKFGERLLQNVTWIDEDDRIELQEAIRDAGEWWDYCEMPFALLKININACGRHLASFTCGPGWVKPTHENRWELIKDIIFRRRKIGNRSLYSMGVYC